MSRNPKTIDQARSNLESVIPLIPERYRAGIDRGKWAEAAASDAAEANFAAKMQEVISKKKRAAGVRAAGDQKWKEGALMKGAPVIAQRMTDSLDKWQQNFGKVYAAVLRVLPTLKPRGVDAMANIDNRLKPVVKASIEAKLR